jgi:DNA-binding PadR family transcriptional regulator
LRISGASLSRLLQNALEIKTVSEDVLQVGESSLYPALQRFLLNGWVTAEWGASENNRRAR